MSSAVRSAVPRHGRLTILLAILICMFLASASHGQQSFVDQQLQPIILKGVDLLTDGSYEEALSEFDRIEEVAPEDPSSDFLRGMLCWHRLVIAGEDNNEIKKLFFDHMDQTIEKAKAIEKQDKEDVRALFWLGAGYGYKARYHSANAEWWSAYRNGKKTTRYFEKVVELAPDDGDPYLGLGIYHYYADVVPKIIRIFDFILNMGGDKELGFRELEQAIGHGFFTKHEAKFFLADVFMKFERRPHDALPLLLDLTQSFPGNTGFKERLATLYGELGFHTEAARTWDRLSTSYAFQLRKRRHALAARAEQMIERGRFAGARSILTTLLAEDSLEDASLVGRIEAAATLTGNLLQQYDQASLETLRKHAEILMKTNPRVESIRSLEEELRGRLTESNKEEKKIYSASMLDIGRYYLRHGDAVTAKSLFDELLDSDLSVSNETEIQIHQSRAVANHRLGLHEERMADLAKVRERASEAIRKEIDRDISFVRTETPEQPEIAAVEDTSSVQAGVFRSWFSCPDREQFSVTIVGDFNDWDPTAGEMVLISGEWYREFDLPPGEYRYHFIENGWRTRIDPAAQRVKQEKGVIYSSVRLVREPEIQIEFAPE